MYLKNEELDHHKMTTLKAHKRSTPVKEQTGKAVFKAHQEGGINVGH